VVFEQSNLCEELFGDLDDYGSFIRQNRLDSLLSIDLSTYGDPSAKKLKHQYYSVDSSFQEPFMVEIDDLVRLFYLVRSRKVVNILEFGVGKSTAIFDAALKLNLVDYTEEIRSWMRRSNPFRCSSVDSYSIWVDRFKSDFKTDVIDFHVAELNMGTFNGRACTFYSDLPNVCPDLIYLDGPDQFSAKGNICGITTVSPDRMPMAADILVLEHFLLPGSLIVVDGRTANARFLKANLQRNWAYCYSDLFDQHYFELMEKPLGKFNAQYLDFSLGNKYFDRLNRSVGN
jgi:hypothetical protein